MSEKNNAAERLKFVIDSNIALDFLADRDFSRPSWRKLFLMGRIGEVELIMSTSQVTDVAYILTKGGRPSLASKAKAQISRLNSCSRFVPLYENEVIAAIESPWEDIEDSCVHEVAKRVQAEAIITRDKRDFARSSIKVFDADELFDYLAREKGLTYDFVPF
ncbi:PIN domain-containing protein [Curtanaerobium respiraculi]|uniref:PIN domain-containing protein n=1 Tax=Curtanaerobium respiraculi TaxID=2949669 RepID=UPI0024B3268A|nr:PIN domain-containing protein [Curtanaerobium respiraculi]